jgi:IS30 family transposase
MRNVCTLEKHLYDARSAQKEYEELRSESRSGYNLTEKELKQLNSVMSPLLKNGQSIHHILTNNPDKILRCEKTIYIYVDNGLFDGRNVDMPRKVRFRPRKKNL